MTTITYQELIEQKIKLLSKVVDINTMDAIKYIHSDMVMAIKENHNESLNWYARLISGERKYICVNGKYKKLSCEEVIDLSEISKDEVITHLDGEILGL